MVTAIVWGSPPKLEVGGIPGWIMQAKPFSRTFGRQPLTAAQPSPSCPLMMAEPLPPTSHPGREDRGEETQSGTGPWGQPKG